MKNLIPRNVARLIISAAILLLIPVSIWALTQTDHPTSFEQLELKADELWLNKYYVQLGPVLNEMLELSKEEDNIAHEVESLIYLHEYEAFYNSNNEMALEYIIKAIDKSDQFDLGELQLKARSKLLYFHQSTTQDEKLVVEILGEMIKINDGVKSEFYTMVNSQWNAQIVGTKRIVGIPVEEEEVKKSIAILKETVNYFDLVDKEHLFYYQQARRCILGFFGDHFGYETCLEYNEEIKSLAPRMKEPITQVANLIFEGTFLSNFKKYDLLIERLEGDQLLLERANHGMSKFYYQLLTEGYAKTENFQAAMQAMQKMHFHDQQVNEIAFSNKVESLRLQNESDQLQKVNRSLSSRNYYAYAVAALLFAGLFIVILSRRKIRKQSNLIDTQRKDLDEANKAKSKLLGILAHDLKAPISSFANLSKRINYLANRKEWDRIDAMTNQLEESVIDLDSILENILAWVSSQFKSQSFEKEKIDISKLVQDCIDELKSTIQKKDIQIINQMNGQIFASIEYESIRIVLRNILSNAIKFSEEGGPITISGNPQGDSTRIVIKDIGVGMGSDMKRDLFLEYKSTTGTKGERGHGLGLRLSKDLVIANGGTITLDSELGYGTTVTLFFPN